MNNNLKNNKIHESVTTVERKRESYYLYNIKFILFTIHKCMSIFNEINIVNNSAIVSNIGIICYTKNKFKKLKKDRLLKKIQKVN